MCVSGNDTAMISLDNHDSAPGVSTRLPEKKSSFIGKEETVNRVKMAAELQ